MNIILFIQKMCLRVRAGQFMRACVSVLYIMLSACMCARTYIYMFA